MPRSLRRFSASFLRPEFRAELSPFVFGSQRHRGKWCVSLPSKARHFRTKNLPRFRVYTVQRTARSPWLVLLRDRKDKKKKKEKKHKKVCRSESRTPTVDSLWSERRLLYVRGNRIEIVEYHRTNTKSRENSVTNCCIFWHSFDLIAMSNKGTNSIRLDSHVRHSRPSKNIILLFCDFTPLIEEFVEYDERDNCCAIIL